MKRVQGIVIDEVKYFGFIGMSVDKKAQGDGYHTLLINEFDAKCPFCVYASTETNKYTHHASQEEVTFILSELLALEVNTFTLILFRDNGHLQLPQMQLLRCYEMLKRAHIKAIGTWVYQLARQIYLPKQ